MVNKYNRIYKERLRKEALEQFKNLSEKEKDKRRQYYLERKQKLPEY